MLMNLWTYLSGKKRTIALIYWAVLVPSMLVIWPNGYIDVFSLVFSKVVIIFGFLLSALGLSHAAVKTRNSQNQQTEEISNESSE